MVNQPDPSGGDLCSASGSDPDDLRIRSVRGASALMAGQGARFALRIAALAYLARTLSPDDFGVIGMVLVLTAFLEVLRDPGLGAATIQRRTLSHDQLSTLFWLNAGFGLVAGALAAAAAPLLAWLYGEPRLVPVALAMSAAFVFSGLGVQHDALLKRRMAFGTTSAVGLLSVALSLAVAVVCAAAGLGIWALVAMVVSEKLFAAAGSWLCAGWRPGAMRWSSDLYGVVSFGGYLTAHNVLRYAARNLDHALVGWGLGAAALGLYGRACELMLAPTRLMNAPLVPVAVSTLARLTAEPERYRLFYRRGLLLLAAVTMPLAVGLVVAADRVVMVVLGTQWLETAELLRAMGLAAFFGSISVAPGWNFLALGRSGRMLKWALLAAPARVLAFAVGLQWGAAGVAWAYSLSSAVLVPTGTLFSFRGTPLRARDLLWSTGWPGVASLGAGLLLHAGRGIWAGLCPALGLGLDAAVYAALYAGLWAALPGGVGRLREMLDLGRALLPTRAAGEPVRA